MIQPQLYRIRLGDLIAEGGCAYVYNGYEVQTGLHFALKKIIVQSTKTWEEIQCEKKYYTTLHHPSLIPLLDFLATTGDGKTIF